MFAFLFVGVLVENKSDTNGTYLSNLLTDLGLDWEGTSRTIDGRDAIVELTWMYSQRVLEVPS